MEVAVSLTTVGQLLSAGLLQPSNSSTLWRGAGGWGSGGESWAHTQRRQQHAKDLMQAFLEASGYPLVDGFSIGEQQETLGIVTLRAEICSWQMGKLIHWWTADTTKGRSQRHRSEQALFIQSSVTLRYFAPEQREFLFYRSLQQVHCSALGPTFHGGTVTKCSVVTRQSTDKSDPAMAL